MALDPSAVVNHDFPSAAKVTPSLWVGPVKAIEWGVAAKVVASEEALGQINTFVLLRKM